MTQEHRPAPPEDWLDLKQVITRHFDLLPAGHQAMMTLALVQTVLEGEYGPWLHDSLRLLDEPSTPEASEGQQDVWVLVRLRHDQLEELFTAGEAAPELNEARVTWMAGQLAQALTDGFWDELQSVVQAMLMQKRGTDSAPDDRG